MAVSIGLSVKAVEKNIQQLKIEGLIARVGPKKGGHWKIL
ncbi:MAG: hypothetical protein LBB56_05560 [Chitinispirillales bacterium]|nr:hypothetical protein [Chitinispirillales bacterium]